MSKEINKMFALLYDIKKRLVNIEEKIVKKEAGAAGRSEAKSLCMGKPPS